MKKKYLLNCNTGTLHIVDDCSKAKGNIENKKYYFTIDDALRDNPRYIKNCKKCHFQM